MGAPRRDLKQRTNNRIREMGQKACTLGMASDFYRAHDALTTYRQRRTPSFLASSSLYKLATSSP